MKILPLIPLSGPSGIAPAGFELVASGVIMVIFPDVEKTPSPGSPETKFTLPPWSYFDAPPRIVTLPPYPTVLPEISYRLLSAP